MFSRTFPTSKEKDVLREAGEIEEQAAVLNAEGRAAARAWPEVAVRLDSGGLGFFSQLGVARRPDLTQYFIDGFARNRDGLAFSEENQAIFAEVFRCITEAMKKHFASGDTVVQTDRQIGDTDRPLLPRSTAPVRHGVPPAAVHVAAAHL